MSPSAAGSESPLAVDLAAVCFDLDDTLYDYHEYARAGLAAAADHLERRTGESFHDELRSLYFNEDVSDGTFDALLRRHDVAVEGDGDAIVQDMVEAYHAATDALSPYPETEAVLTRLQERYELGLITDGRGGRAKLCRLGIDDYFDAVVVSPELDSSKHQRDVFEAALADLDGGPTETVYVGDDPRVDFRVPNRLGMATVRLSRGRYTHLDADSEAAAPDVEIDSIGELLDIVT